MTVPLMFFAWATALGVVAALATIIRLITTPQAGPVPPSTGGGVGYGATGGGVGHGYGLLRPVAMVDTAARAGEVRRILAHAGVRTTTATGADGRIRVLVFEDEYDRARRLMA